MMAVLVMKCPDGNLRPLVQLSAEEFVAMQKKIGDVKGIPIYWSEGIGVLPEPLSPDYTFVLEDEF